MITQIKTNNTIVLLTVAGASLVLAGIILLGYSYTNKLFPNTSINSIDVSGLTIEESITLLENSSPELQEHEFTLFVDDIALSSSSAQLEHHLDFETAVRQAFIDQHSQPVLFTIPKALASYAKTHSYQAKEAYSRQKVAEFVGLFNKQIEFAGQNPSVDLKVSGVENSLVVFTGKSGRTVVNPQTSEAILQAIAQNNHSVAAQVASTSSILDPAAVQDTLVRTKPFVGKKLELQVADKTIFLNDKQLVSFVNPIGGYFDQNISEYIQQLAEKMNQEPQNAVFEYDEQTLEVTQFEPHEDGLEIVVEPSVLSVTTVLQEFEEAAVSAGEDNLKTMATIKTKSPEITLGQTNTLGINEKIGFGESYYQGSIPNRVHNVAITADKITLTIVPAGADFSFNKTVGEISARTGYRSAYVISGGKTVLGDGGGVCQVSSTLFRAVLDAGLDVTKRLQHSYRVGYYELNSQPGFDATVYSGDVDFRFKNDTANALLIVAKADSSDLYMDVTIYGTSDGRTSTISDYKQWGAVPPLPTEYYPTTDLPAGQRKQIDWSVSGLKTEFKHTVLDKNGSILHEDVYYSNYRPWSAKYLVGV